MVCFYQAQLNLSYGQAAVVTVPRSSEIRTAKAKGWDRIDRCRRAASKDRVKKIKQLEAGKRRKREL